MENKKFEDVWRKVGPHVTRTAVHMLGYHDGQDVAQDVAVMVWGGDEDREDDRKLAAFWRRKTKWKCLDFMRKRRRLVLVDKIDDDLIGFTRNLTCVRDDLSEYIPHDILDLLLAGYSQNETAKRTGKSKAFISRTLASASLQAKTNQKQQETENMSGTIRHKVKSSGPKQSTIIVYAGRSVIATAKIPRDGSDFDIKMTKGCAIEPSEISEYLLEVVPSEMREPKQKAAKKPKQSSGMLDTLKDFPASLEAWQKKVGGKGKCLGGSGQDVKKRFAPGWDAKLKSALKRVGSANAKSLAKELGWEKIIKWAN